MPTPRPDRSVTSGAVENPGAKIRSTICVVGHAVERGRRDDIARARDLADPRDVDAAAVVLDFDDHVLALPGGPKDDRRRRWLAELGPFGRAFEPVVQAVAQDMQQRLGDRLDDRLVGFRRGALDHQARGLAEGGGHLADEARETLEGMMQRQDAQAEHGALQFADQALQQQMLVLERDRQAAGIGRLLGEPGGMADGVLGDQQFAGQPDERIDALDVDAQGDVGRLRGQRAGRLGRRLRQALEDAVDRRRHRRGIAGEKAALQQAFQVGRIQRPALVAQHVRRDPAGRFQPSGCALGRRFRQQELLRLEKLPGDGRQPGAGRRRRPRIAQRQDRGLIGGAEARKAPHEIVGLGVGVGRDFAGHLHLVDPGADLVEAGQAKIDQKRRHRGAARAHRRKNVLGGVQGARHGGEIDDAGGALQRVEGAERAVEPLLVVGPLLERQQVVVALRDEFAPLDQELFDEFVHAGSPHRMATCSTSASWRTGLTR